MNFTRTQRIHKTLVINQELKNTIENIQNIYTWIVLTEAWCGDSAQNLPVIAEIAKLNPDKIKLYILLRDENPELMDNYLTNGPQGRRLHRNYWHHGKRTRKGEAGMSLKRNCIVGMQRIKRKRFSMNLFSYYIH
ncbi:MAG: thioredoxin family protein [Ferruginibacter sp.]